MKTLSTLFSLITWGVFICVIIIAVFIFSSNATIGGYRSYLVQSGSMEPTINTGDIVLVQPQSNYHQRDVITFVGEDNRVVTHRIASLKKNNYLTKGDANRSEDEALVTRENVLGKVILVVPKIGFFVGFAKSPLGLVLLIIVPAGLLIANELLTIYSNRKKNSHRVD